MSQLDKVKGELADAQALAERYLDNIRRLLRRVGTAAECEACRTPVWFVRDRGGHVGCYDALGTDHVATCPQAYRRPAEGPLRPPLKEAQHA